MVLHIICRLRTADFIPAVCYINCYGLIKSIFPDLKKLYLAAAINKSP